MSSRRRSKSAARTSTRTRSAPRRQDRPARDFWGIDHTEDREPAPIRPTHDPTALIHSLGPPPLPNGAAARHYFDAIYERAANLAMALATSADLIEHDEAD
jgi:hypothetical protein